MMKKFLYVGSMLVLLLVIRPASANVSLLIFGDSLSAGYGISQADTWVAEIERRWQQDYPEYSIINASISGDTTQGGLRRLAEVVERHQPDAVFIELGGNDGLRGFQIDSIRSNLSEMIHYLQNRDIHVALSQIEIPPNMGPRYTDQFRSLFANIAEQHNVELVPFFMLDIATDPGLMQSDGIHPNLQAQEAIADIMEPQLRAIAEQAASE
ncbi:arylesterase [Aliidiomarina sedimenti]|nr:arylesterase [Aliidiomarina sedimenti]